MKCGIETGKWALKAVAIVMKELGKFQALSLTVRDQQPQIMEEWSAEMNDMIITMLQGSYGKIMERALNVSVEHVDNPDVMSVITELRNTHVELMESIFKTNAAGRFGVIGHGDFYKNNIL